MNTNDAVNTENPPLGGVALTGLLGGPLPCSADEKLDELLRRVAAVERTVNEIGKWCNGQHDRITGLFDAINALAFRLVGDELRIVLDDGEGNGRRLTPQLWRASWASEVDDRQSA